MGEKRFLDLVERTTLNNNDFFAVDKAADGTKKVNAGIITNQFADINNILGAKNMLKYPYRETTKAENGLTFTDLGNGKVTVSGTATAETTFYLDYTNAFADKNAGTYILSGCPEGGNRPNGYFLEISGRATASDNWTTIATDIGAGATFTITTEMLSWVSIHVFIRVRSGKAISTPITYAPMIRLASIQDDTWEPYAKTNAQLTSELGNPSAASGVSGSNAFAKIASLNNALTTLANNETWQLVDSKTGSQTISIQDEDWSEIYIKIVDPTNSTNRTFLFYIIRGPWSVDLYYLRDGYYYDSNNNMYCEITFNYIAPNNIQITPTMLALKGTNHISSAETTVYYKKKQ